MPRVRKIHLINPRANSDNHTVEDLLNRGSQLYGYVRHDNSRRNKFQNRLHRVNRERADYLAGAAGRRTSRHVVNLGRTQ